MIDESFELGAPPVGDEFGGDHAVATLLTVRTDVGVEFIRLRLSDSDTASVEPVLTAVTPDIKPRTKQYTPDIKPRISSIS